MSFVSDKRLLRNAAKELGLTIPRGFRWAVPSWGAPAQELMSEYQRVRSFPVTGYPTPAQRRDMRVAATPLRHVALQIMLKMEASGVHETSMNRSPFIDHMKEYVNGYTDSLPWCADAVTYCFKKASGGVWPKAGCFNHRYCPSWVEAARTNKCNLSTRTRDIDKGDVVLFDWDNDGVADHVGLVRAALPGLFRVTAGPIPTVEGNTGITDSGLGFGDGVESKWRTRGSVMAFVRVGI